MDPAAACGPVSTAPGLSLVVETLEVFTMHALEPAAAGADDVPLDTWLRHALRQAFGGTLSGPLPPDLLALAAGRPQSCGLRLPVGNARGLGRTEEAREQR
jgi:hypothetical protein